MSAHAGSTTLNDWRKRLLKSKAVDISSQEWTTVFDILTSRPDLDQASDLLALLLVTLRQLTSLLADEAVPKIGLPDLLHTTLVPSLQEPKVDSKSLARLIIDSLQSTSKPLQIRATDCLAAASKLAIILPRPETSTSKPVHLLVPLFRYIVNQGIDQKWTLGALANILPSIPLEEVRADLLDNFKGDMEISENAAIRATVISQILRSRWASHDRSHRQSDTDFHRIVYEPVLALFNPSINSPETWRNVQRYLYPALNTLQTPSGTDFLHYLEKLPSDLSFDEDALLECWITIASSAVQARTLGIRDIDETRLHRAFSHAKADIRLKAFAVCTQNEDVFHEKGISGIKAGFRYNANLHGTGERSDLGAAIHNYFTYLAQETHVAARAAQRITQGHTAIKGFAMKDESDGKPCPRQTILANPKQAIEIAEEIKWHILEEWIRPGLQSARRHPVSRILVSLIILKHLVDVFASEAGMQETIFTRETVEDLLACQASEFADVRRRARAILDSSTVPLPGYETLDTPCSRRLLASAYSSLSHPRRTQADAGRSTLCVIFTKLVHGLEAQTHFLSSLISRLEDHVEASERNLIKVIEEKPLHGLLAATRDITECIDMSDTQARTTWRPIFHQLLSLVDRVWAITRPVISLKSAVGPGQGGRPDHEIARAYEVANAGDPEGEGDGDDESPGITGLISGCWRATTGAGDLLSTILTVGISPAPNDSTAVEAIWDRCDVDDAGERFLTWMQEIRHRGTFSKLATAFTTLIQSVKKTTHLADLPLAWLDKELSTVREGKLSTTRRSAALPYSILALIVDDADLTDRAMLSLFELAEVQSSTSDVTKVHAFNVLQVCMPDAKQAKFLERYFERAVMTAIGAFGSLNWNVRNVGLILFSTLIYRSLNLAKSQDLFEYRYQPIRQTYLAWHNKYPRLLPYITSYLANHDIGAGSSQHSPLLPILIIIRSLRHSDNGKTIQDALVPAVERILGSREWQVRKVAGQALASLLSHQEALLRATNFDKLARPRGNNELHGRLHFLALIIENVIEWPKVDNLSKRQVERNLSSLVAAHGDSPLLDISNTVIRAVGSYFECAESTNATLLDATARVAARLHKSPAQVGVPIQGMQLWFSATFLLQSKPTTETLSTMLASSNASPHVQQCPALWALEGMMGPQADYASLVDNAIFAQVVILARSSVHDDSVRLSAMGALRSVEWSEDVLQSVDTETRRDFVRDMTLAVRRTKYVPVREAGLPALAWGLGWLAMAGEDDVSLVDIGEELLKSSHEDESLPARESAMEALALLTTELFPVPDDEQERAGELLLLHRTLDRLLHDDDMSLRIGASDIIRKGLEHPSPICQEEAVDVWRSWIIDYIRRHPSTSADWKQWLVDQVIDESGIEADERALLSATHQPDVLFEVEPSNLFRDTLATSAQLADLLSATDLALSEQDRSRLRDARARVGDLVERASAMALSPIDDAWEAARTLRRRAQVFATLP